MSLLRTLLLVVAFALAAFAVALPGAADASVNLVERHSQNQSGMAILAGVQANLTSLLAKSKTCSNSSEAMNMLTLANANVRVAINAMNQRGVAFDDPISDIIAIINDIVNLVTAIISAVLDLLSGQGGAAIATLLNAVTTLLMGIVSLVPDILDLVLSIITGLISTVVGLVGSLVGSLLGSL